jgi:glycosyltransferase involved in cell wall biosynthesis
MSRQTPALRALLVDPALFTAPYDVDLDRGLKAAGVQTRWVGRPLRQGETLELPAAEIEALYYRGVQDTAKGRGLIWKLRKGLSHVLGGLRLIAMARRGGYQVVHVQWALLPAYDRWIMRRLSRRAPVVLTVHDVEPYNGSPTSSLQKLGLDRVFAAADRLVVHTEPARAMLRQRGVDDARIAVIPHGPLSLGVEAPLARSLRPAGAPWRIVLFGKLQPYKGLDLLIEALGLLSPAERARLHVTVAGEPLMPMEPLAARIAELGLTDIIQLRLKRLEETEMAALFAEADAFVFPYRQIQASGVLYLVAPYRRWLIASDLGIFSEFIVNDANGERVAPGSPEALAGALVRSIGREPDPASSPPLMTWDEIGLKTRSLYEDALAQRRSAA